MRLIDTTVAVDHLRGDDRATTLLERIIREDKLVAASELTRFEVLAGMPPGEREQTESFFSSFSWIPVDEQISRLAGRLAWDHRRPHRGIGVVDYLIAATATLVGAGLLTTNVRHFPMFAGLEPAY
ncbi:MAG TPA: type II toxin-antitoxin system VapC family toxin [Acidimicrobiales bacterium]|nr:type II toxin-antitoxin system VapC family toxin [Acidimicrobiales bacterium]